jgi:type I restriction enzyme R subunit
MEFVRLYGKILKLRNILVSFDEFNDDETLNEREVQDYSSMYIDAYEHFRKQTEPEAVNVNEDLVFEIELLKQIEINVDYILLLVDQYNKSGKSDKKLRTDIDRAVNSSIELRNKKELIDEFIEGLNK